ncbi:hypothetical protein FRC06_005148 [Ceratobasidium sp. 370]|nr:hypothetical protein FRC06_005148 [Ceratobasidium sp. 370]
MAKRREHLMKALASARHVQQATRREINSGDGPARELVWEESLGPGGIITANHILRIPRSSLRKSDNTFDHTAHSSPNDQPPNTCHTEPKPFRFAIAPHCKYGASESGGAVTCSDTVPTPVPTTPTAISIAEDAPTPKSTIGVSEPVGAHDTPLLD